jgi:hypothetical protein
VTLAAAVAAEAWRRVTEENEVRAKCRERCCASAGCRGSTEDTVALVNCGHVSDPETPTLLFTQAEASHCSLDMGACDL